MRENIMIKKKFMFIIVMLGALGGSLVFSEELAPTTDGSAQAPKTTPGKIKKSKSSPAVLNVTPPNKSTQSASLEAWLKKLKEKLSKRQTKNNRLVAVAAVRGSETKDAAPLYWKGLKNEGPVDDAELKDFEAALDAAQHADQKVAMDKFQAFVAAHPKSPMADDAQETLNRLRKEPLGPTDTK